MTLFEQDLPPAVDMHCHLSDSGGYSSAEPNVLLLSVTNDPMSWSAMHNQDDHAGVTWALGLHPCLVLRDDSRLPMMIESMRGASAIGEIGLDYSQRARCSAMEQRRILERILARPEASDRVVTLHSVGATSDIVAAVATHGVRGAVLHWFLGTPADVDAAIDADVYFSVNAAMTRSQRGRTALDEMPPNRVLVETDAPFTKVGKSISRPGEVRLIEQKLAKLWRTDPQDVRRRLWSNLRALQERLNVVLFPSERRLSR